MPNLRWFRYRPTKKDLNVSNLRSLPSLLRHADTRTTRLPSKLPDAIYRTPEFQAWREVVVARAGHRCEAVDAYGYRCMRAAPQYRMYADHVIELRDNGEPFDLNNGQCLCRSHHEIKTIAARDRRLKGVV